MNPIYIFSILVILLLATSSTPQTINQSWYISCGLPRSTTTTSPDNRKWRSDDNSTFSPPNINTISTTATAPGLDPPYDKARLFQVPLTYTFSLPPGPKFLRLYFTTSISYNNIEPSNFFLNLNVNNLIFFKNFSPFLNSPNNTKISKYEFHVTVETHLNLTFSPGDLSSNSTNTQTTNTYGFINALEIVPIPKGLYINETEFLSYLTNPQNGYTVRPNTALQTVYRLNVGGTTTNPSDDSGSMWRTWFNDFQYLAPGSFPGADGGLQYGTPAIVNYTMIPTYVAPAEVYGTERVLGNQSPEFNMKNNLSWVFGVDPGFDYLMRLHFCEMSLDVTVSGGRVFDVYIGNQTALQGFDVWASSGGTGVPIYRDFVIRADSGGGDGGGGGAAMNGTKVLLWLVLHPVKDMQIVDVLLNGLEILKLSEFDGNGSYYLAAPNPPNVESPPPSYPINGGSKHNSPPIIGGAIGGAILVSLIICACLVAYKRRTNNVLKRKTTASYTTSKDYWAPPKINSGSTTSNVSSSLPSDLCRCFSLVQIRVATCDFDEKLIVGKGGFGNVYKGSIDGGATKVAIKRLNTTSKQGAREFQNEIEMLSRLRHVHLVSLIGYCEDLGEMILVYEYMPRGTLRDHLLYKKSERNDGEDDHSNTPVSWKQRLNICVGSARGLHYLHAGAKQLVIHRDVKSTNILLDDKWTAKVSDFGLSKMGPMHHESGTTHVSTAVKGSIGYLDPEYYRRQQLSEKSDVYSFGVVLFEVLCARPAMNPNLSKEQVNLALWARKHYKNGTLHTIIDPNLTGQIAPECLRKFGEIAETCVRDRGSERPSMGDVVWGLEFALELQETAEKNNISGGNIDEILGNPGSFQLSGGVDDVLYDNSDTISVDNFTKSTNIEFGEKRLLDSKTTTSNSSDYRIDMKSGSVFSEIIDPQAR